MGMGHLSRSTQCSPETIRYCEQQGLLCVAERSKGVHRKFRETHYKMLKGILHAEHLDFGQYDDRRLVEMADPAKTDCDNVQDLAAQKLSETRAKIRDLRQLEKSLETLFRNCETGRVSAECPLIDSLMD